MSFGAAYLSRVVKVQWGDMCLEITLKHLLKLDFTEVTFVKEDSIYPFLLRKHKYLHISF